MALNAIYTTPQLAFPRVMRLFRREIFAAIETIQQVLSFNMAVRCHCVARSVLQATSCYHKRPCAVVPKRRFLQYTIAVCRSVAFKLLEKCSRR